MLIFFFTWRSYFGDRKFPSLYSCGIIFFLNLIYLIQLRIVLRNLILWTNVKKIKLTIYKDITVFSYDYVVHERINAHTFEPRKFSNESKFDLNDRVSDALFRKQLFFYKFKFNHTLKNILWLQKLIGYIISF